MSKVFEYIGLSARQSVVRDINHSLRTITRAVLKSEDRCLLLDLPKNMIIEFLTNLLLNISSQHKLNAVVNAGP